MQLVSSAAGECPFSSAACAGKVAAGDKCLFVVSDTNDKFSYNKAADQCRKRGGRPAVPKTPEDMAHVLTLIDLFKYIPSMVYIGLRFVILRRNQ
jgi:hypothetical protein